MGSTELYLNRLGWAVLGWVGPGWDPLGCFRLELGELDWVQLECALFCWNGLGKGGFGWIPFGWVIWALLY